MEKLFNYCKNYFSEGIDKYKFTRMVLLLNGIFSGITLSFISLIPIIALLGWSKADVYGFNTILVYTFIGLIYYGIFFSFIIKRIRDIFSNNDAIFWCSVTIVFLCFILSIPIPFLSLILLTILFVLMYTGNPQKQRKFYIIGFIFNIILSFVIWIAFNGSFSITIPRIIKEPARKQVAEQQMQERNAARGRWIGDLYIAKMPVQEKKTVGKTILNAQKVCTDVGMRLPSKEDFEYISEILYSGDVDALSDTDFRKFSNHKMQDNLQWLSDWNGDYYTSSTDSNGKNIIYNMKINPQETCRFITLYRNAYEWSAVDTCIRYSVVEKPYSYPISPRYKTNQDKFFRTVCVSN